MDNNIMQMAVFAASIVTVVVTITICLLKHNNLCEKLKNERLEKLYKDAFDKGYEQKFIVEETQSSDYAWVKKA